MSTQNPQTNPPPETAQPKAEPAKTKSKLVRLVAVHGEICHATDGTRFPTDESKKHELDAWCQIQIEAGKLRIDTDE